MFRIARALAFALPFSLPVPPASAAENYPLKPVRFVVPFAPGGVTDLLGRAVSDKLGEALGATIIIDNRPGAGSTIGAALVARATPDGYTFLLASASYTFTPSLYKDLPYDPLKDFKPITIVGSTPNFLVVHPSMPVRSVKEFIALARKRPGEILFGSGGHGSNIHLTMELFAYMAGIKLAHVPYKGAGPAQVALMSGEVQALMPGSLSVLPFIRNGQIRALAVTTRQRTPLLPELPTIDEAGVPGYDKSAWFALFAPAAVPEPIVARLYQAVVRALKDPDVVKRLAAEGASPGGQPPAEFDAFVRSELELWAKLTRDMKL